MKTIKYKCVYAIGVFDLFHRGHIEFLNKAHDLGERLIVSVNSDRLVAEYKRRPVYSETDRLAIVSACKYVDDAFIIDTYDNRDAIERYKVDAVVHGDDWPAENYKHQIRVTDEFLREHGTDLVLVNYSIGVSTSDIIKRIKAQ